MSADSWVPTLKNEQLPSCCLYNDVVASGCVPEDGAWSRKVVMPGLNVASDPNTIWAAVLAIWRLMSCEGPGVEDPSWKKHLKAWLIRYARLISDTRLKPLPCLLEFVSLAISCRYVKEAEVPLKLATALELEGRKTSVPTSSNVSQPPTSMGPFEGSMDVDNPPLTTRQKSCRKTTTQPSSSLEIPPNEVQIGPLTRQAAKCSRVDSDVDTEDEKVGKNVEKKRAGKKAGKKNAVKKNAEMDVEQLGYFMVRKDPEVVLKADDAIQSIDLGKEEVIELTLVDLKMVPFLENKSCMECYKQSKECQPVWRWYKCKKVSFWCESCKRGRTGCTLSLLQVKLQEPPKIILSEEGEEIRAKNRREKRVSNERKASQTTGRAKKQANTQGTKKQKVVVSESEESSVDELVLPSSPRATGPLPSITSFSQSTSFPSIPSLINISPFRDVLLNEERSALLVHEVVANVLAVRCHEQYLLTKLSKQVEDREVLYTRLLGALEKEARILELVEEETAGPRGTQKTVLSSSSRARTMSEPAVAVMLEEVVEDSEDSETEEIMVEEE